MLSYARKPLALSKASFLWGAFSGAGSEMLSMAWRYMLRLRRGWRWMSRRSMPDDDPFGRSFLVPADTAIAHPRSIVCTLSMEPGFPLIRGSLFRAGHSIYG